MFVEDCGGRAPSTAFPGLPTLPEVQAHICYIKNFPGDFPGGPVAKAPNLQEARVQSLVGELDPQVATKSLHATAKDPVCLPLGSGTADKFFFFLNLSGPVWFKPMLFKGPL